MLTGIALATMIGSLGLSPSELQGQQGSHQVPRHVRSADSELAIKVRVDGSLVPYKGIVPIMQGSRILVPMRGLFEHLGATLTWDAEKRIVTATGSGKTIILPVGQVNATVDGKTVTLDQPAMIIDNSTFVPLRFVGEALGAKVSWLDADRVVSIDSKQSG